MPSDRKTLPRGVSRLSHPRGGRSYRARIRHRGVDCHLGIYETAYLAGLAYHLAAESVGRRSSPPPEIPGQTRPSAADIRLLTTRVASRLGNPVEPASAFEPPPSLENLVAFFEVTVLGFWRRQAALDHADAPGAAIDSAAARIVQATHVLMNGRTIDLPEPRAFLLDLLARRLDSAFRRSDLTQDVLHDDGDEMERIARWLVYPDELPSGRGFRDEIRFLSAEFFEDASDLRPGWVEILGVVPPITLKTIREAYRRRSKAVHPDLGGLADDFVKLQRAYEEAMAAWKGRRTS